ncbi:YggN family protein [Vibrio sp. SCSIO 43136]|uniref:YggN family protein n=1 Tax=Vibrio sp. SCSIO 43136 TaxID=2819101 RepID=UPI002075CC0A|nr:YggN family protein [Vibrio sp. SCSIO 43136]USD64692.1 YggN family protein [Vibrio sp. SCSIO 43136]
MRNLLIAITVALASHGAHASNQCRVSLQSEVRVDGEQVKVYQQGNPKVLIDENNNLFIDGKQIELDAMQEEAINSYREKMNHYLPKAKQIAQDGVDLAKEIVDDISTSFDNSEAFDNVRTAIDQFYADLEARYYQEGEFRLKEQAFADVWSNWQANFDAMLDNFNSEFFSSAFTALSEKMKAEGGINLTELKEKMAELKASLESKVSEESEQIQQQAEQYCDDLEGVATEEQQLHEKIPQLKNYRVFTI